MREDPWYSQLRARWRPTPVRLLLVGESAPDPGATDRRFFYSPTISQADNLFRGVVMALYGAAVKKGEDRTPWLAGLRDDGVWLIDLVKYPVDKMTVGRARARRENVEDRVREILEINPAGIIICHKPTYEVLAPPLFRARLPLLHDRAMPFPDGVHRAEFVRDFQAAHANLRGSNPDPTESDHG